MNNWSPTRAFTVLILLICVGVYFVSCRKEPEELKIVNKEEKKETVPDWNTTEISGKVQIPDRDVHEDILVFAAGKSLMVYTDEEGGFTFLKVPLGTYNFKARLAGYQTASLGTVTVEGDINTPPEPITLPTVVLEKESLRPTAKRIGGLVGKVETETGGPAVGALVQILGSLYKTVTDDEGVYRFFNLTADNYTLRISKGGYGSQTISVAIQSGTPTYAHSVRLQPIVESAKTCKIFGSVDMYDLKGEPIKKYENVIVSLEGTSYVAMPNSEGKFLFEKIPPEQYVINSTAPGFQSRNKIEVDLTNLDYTNVSLVLDEVPSESASKGLVRGVVNLENADDHSGASVALTGTSIVAISDIEGRYLLSNVPEGTYTVLAQAEGYVPVYIENVEVRPGEEIELEKMALELRVEPPQVIYTDPGDGQSEVLVQKTTPLYVRFSKQMRPGSLKRAFSISPSVDFRIYVGRENRQSDYDLLFVELLGASEKDPLSFDTRYSVTVSSSATDFENLTLEEDYTFSFTTGKASITGSIPFEDETNASVNLQSPALVFFNASIDPETINMNTVDFSPDPVSNPSFRVRNDPDTGWSVIQIFVQLEPDTRYTLTLDSGIRTDGGSYISNTPYRIRFRTSERREAIELGPRL